MTLSDTRKTSLIDVPKKHNAKDCLAIEKYQNALIKLIKGADTPLTIALQGEWGSGKTSLMNTLQYRLTDELSEECCFYHAWVNTWEYSIMGQPEDAIGRILRSIILQISQFAPEQTRSFAEKAMGHVRKAGKALVTVSQLAVNVAGKSVAGVDNITGMGHGYEGSTDDDGKPESEISKAKNEIQKMLEQCMTATGSSKKGFLFFIDDLDRIDPPVAVQILELLKNIFDLENCIFILAIDYEVVVKGLKPKFGEPTTANEREFRSFFDKIIQLPFSMPVATYQIDEFLIDSLLKIGYIDQDEAKTSEMTQALSKFARASIGTNPRSLKRLVNILSLLRLIGDENRSQEMFQKIVDFALVCIQISYPTIYNVLTSCPNYPEWDVYLQNKLDLKALSDEERTQLKDQEEFDETWEVTLYMLCKREPFLKSRASEISKILNGIRELIPETKELHEVMKSALQISSVTHVGSQSQDVISVSTFNQSIEIKRLNNILLPKLNQQVGTTGFKEVSITNKRFESWLNYVASGNEMIKCGFKVSIWPEQVGMTLETVTSAWILYNRAQSTNITDDLTRLGIDPNQFLNVKEKIQTAINKNPGFNPRFKESITRRKSDKVLYFDHVWSIRFQLKDLVEISSDRFTDYLTTVICELLNAKNSMFKLLADKLD